MKPLSIMVIAGDPSGDTLAGELVRALRAKAIAAANHETADVQPMQTALAPRFFGAGGPQMTAAGVELAFDLTQHSVIGFSEALKNLGKFRRLFKLLVQLAIERQPDVIVGVDYGGFNLRFAKAIRAHLRKHQGLFNNWKPKIVQFVSPQVWASRPGRAYTLAENHDLLLSIFPFESEWYARRVPHLPVKFVGHPMIGRNRKLAIGPRGSGIPMVVLLPGSRIEEVRRHWPLLLTVAEQIAAELPCSFKAIFPTDELVGLTSEDECRARARSLRDKGVELDIQIGGVNDALAQADLAITKSGTVTVECALYRVPAVVFYQMKWLTYAIAKRIVTVKHFSMPNLLANDEIYPEFVQDAATPENLARAGVELLRNSSRRADVQKRLAQVVASLGAPGAPNRAAKAILELLA